MHIYDIFFVDLLTDMASDTDLVKELNYKLSWLKVIIPVLRKLMGMGRGANVSMVKTVELNFGKLKTKCKEGLKIALDNFDSIYLNISIYFMFF